MQAACERVGRQWLVYYSFHVALSPLKGYLKKTTTPLPAPLLSCASRSSMPPPTKKNIKILYCHTVESYHQIQVTLSKNAEVWNFFPQITVSSFLGVTVKSQALGDVTILLFLRQANCLLEWQGLSGRIWVEINSELLYIIPPSHWHLAACI